MVQDQPHGQHQSRVLKETEQRLRHVIAAADLVVIDGVWAFREAPLDQPPTLGPELLAVVRDEDTRERAQDRC